MSLQAYIESYQVFSAGEYIKDFTYEDTSKGGAIEHYCHHHYYKKRKI